MTGRKLKKKMMALLCQKDFEKSLKEILSLPAKTAINPLFSFLYHQDESIRKRSVTAMGALVSNLADSDMASARIIMRRLMWNLNDESGGIGWGSPEAMGEIMAQNEQIACEYHKILLSYIDPRGGNYIENELLQKDVLRGIKRLAKARPGLVKDYADLLIPWMISENAELRGLAEKTTGILNEH